MDSLSVIFRSLLHNGACVEHQAILVYAPEGSGKSVLLARVCKIAVELFGSETIVIMRYVGLTSRLKSRSQSLRDLLSSICTQLHFLLNYHMDLMKVNDACYYDVATMIWQAHSMQWPMNIYVKACSTFVQFWNDSLFALI